MTALPEHAGQGAQRAAEAVPSLLIQLYEKGREAGSTIPAGTLQGFSDRMIALLGGDSAACSAELESIKADIEKILAPQA